jgi:hypothetical protein
MGKWVVGDSLAPERRVVGTISNVHIAEILIGTDPDQGSGLTELLITGWLLGAAAMPAAMARREYRRPRSRWAR